MPSNITDKNANDVEMEIGNEARTDGRADSAGFLLARFISEGGDPYKLFVVKMGVIFLSFYGVTLLVMAGVLSALDGLKGFLTVTVLIAATYLLATFDQYSLIVDAFQARRDARLAEKKTHGASN